MATATVRLIVPNVNGGLSFNVPLVNTPAGSRVWAVSNYAIARLCPVCAQSSTTTVSASYVIDYDTWEGDRFFVTFSGSGVPDEVFGVSIFGPGGFDSQSSQSTNVVAGTQAREVRVEFAAAAPGKRFPSCFAAVESADMPIPYFINLQVSSQFTIKKPATGIVVAVYEDLGGGTLGGSVWRGLTGGRYNPVAPPGLAVIADDKPYRDLIAVMLGNDGVARHYSIASPVADVTEVILDTTPENISGLVRIVQPSAVTYLTSRRFFGPDTGEVLPDPIRDVVIKR